MTDPNLTVANCLKTRTKAIPMGKSRAPEAREVGEFGIVVHRTHDVELARALAYAFERDRRGYSPGEELSDWETITLPEPVPTWLRVRPAGPDEEYAFWYKPGKPGQRGSFRAVEFPMYGMPAMGTRVANPASGRSADD